MDILELKFQPELKLSCRGRCHKPERSRRRKPWNASKVERPCQEFRVASIDETRLGCRPADDIVHAQVVDVVKKVRRLNDELHSRPFRILPQVKLLAYSEINAVEVLAQSRIARGMK